MVESRVVGRGPGTRPEQTGGRPWTDRGRPVAAPIMDGKQTCAALKGDGTRCGALPIKGVGICIGHQRQQEAMQRAQQD